MQARRKKKKIDVPGLPEWLTVARAYQTCDKVMHRKLAEAGLTVPQYDLLMSLMKKDGQTQQELAERLLVVKSNVSSLLSRAERDGFVERRENPEDGRGKVVTLTGAGKRLARRGWKVQAEVVTTMFESMTPRELEQVAQTMKRVRQALEPLLDAD
ncbi:MAG: MarR family winged helix-turn-helix transcriptional regulator [Deltaproteobacteria bacterium]|nr:MarR family winged helix-turn-helix transcriptional regulator [Deltaproteobacteria bacterium]NND30845.1 winged helix-turn-helix transcriptional regulator [Myxococcales bacterium]MBT8464717.1 MarR family winged helix-turn-helix transcriptional regulator [Deltaproteobacteria bacterium]NNK06153.1 winged helix-turn-helix transcriptional regulator [Myxococcales bacterium]NNK43309.1 winged helix-turn-helix transcriptional regulator [Myxococcales bacterium]